MMNVDLCVIGGGPGGYIAALKAGQMGLKVAVVEKSALGGVCLNVGCIPTKNMLEIGHIYEQAQMSGHMGVIVSGVSFDMQKALSFMASVQNKLQKGIAGLFQKYKIQHISEKGYVASKGVVKTDSNQTIYAKKILIATGSTPIMPPIKGLDDIKHIVKTSHSIWSDMPKQKEHLLIVGGGVIAVEFASFYAMIGAKVTVVERLPRIIASEDPEASEGLKKSLEKRGVDIRVGASVEAFEGKSAIVVDAQGVQDKIAFDSVLMAVGVQPNTKGVSEVELASHKNGALKVDDFLQTSVPDIYAVGDIVDGPALAHKASHEGLVAVENMFSGKRRRVEHHLIPRCVYSVPQVASIGRTVEEVESAGTPYKVGMTSYAHNGRALSADQNVGFVKMIYHAETGEILGAHIFGENASELISSVGVAVACEGTSDTLEFMVFAHPTLSEMVQEATWRAFNSGGHA